MTVLAITSTRSSPGVTSLAVGLSFAWDQMSSPPLLVEADPTGGVLGLRFDLSVEPSLVTLGADMRRGYEPWHVYSNSSDLRGVHCLLGPTDPLVANRTLERVNTALAENLPRFELPTIIDLGRLHDASPAISLACCADQVLIVTRPLADDVQSALFGIRKLQAVGCDVSLVVVGDRPYDPAEVAQLADVPLAAVLPDDPAVASALLGGKFAARKFKRSLLWRSITSLGERLLDGNPELELDVSRPSLPPLSSEPEVEADELVVRAEPISEITTDSPIPPEQVDQIAASGTCATQWVHDWSHVGDTDSTGARTKRRAALLPPLPSTSTLPLDPGSTCQPPPPASPTIQFDLADLRASLNQPPTHVEESFFASMRDRSTMEEDAFFPEDDLEPDLEPDPEADRDDYAQAVGR